MKEDFVSKIFVTLLSLVPYAFEENFSALM